MIKHDSMIKTHNIKHVNSIRVSALRSLYTTHKLSLQLLLICCLICLLIMLWGIWCLRLRRIKCTNTHIKDETERDFWRIRDRNKANEWRKKIYFKKRLLKWNELCLSRISFRNINILYTAVYYQQYKHTWTL